MLKSTLPNNAKSIKDFNKLEEQISQISELLGQDALYRLMVDSAISQSHEAFFKTANPVVRARKLFDPEYPYRIADWGGGYPRPLWEVLKHTWKAEEGEDSIKVSEDPALQEKALAEGRLLRKTLYKQFEEDIDLHRKAKIRKLQELKTEKEKIL